jgi:O-acetyl-ADP-ribose deacetylase (regulator of RNase III)
MSTDPDPMAEHCRDFSSFLPMFGPDTYYLSLLHLGSPKALEVAGECLRACGDSDSEIKAMLEQYGWREDLVAGAALLAGGASEVTLQAMWDALDADSWVVPQLTVLLSALDPEAHDKMKKRLLLGCPVKPRGRDNMSSVERHIIHGTSAIQHQSAKAWSSFCWHIALADPDWMLRRFGADEAWKRLLDSSAHEGADTVNSWNRTLRQMRPDLGLPESLDCGSESDLVLAKRWRVPSKETTYECPDETVEELFKTCSSVAKLLAPLIREGMDKGDRLFKFTSDSVQSEQSKTPLSPGLKSAIISYIPLYTGVAVLEENEDTPELLLLMKEGGNLRVRHRTPQRKLEGRIELTRDRLEHAMTDVICYGAKDTGEMGGGAAMAVLQSCGPEVLEAAREALVRTTRQVGEVVFTPAFGHECTVYVGHVISIKTGTSQGDWCPAPGRLDDGVYQALKTLPTGAKTVAFSCLATGEGRAEPKEVARMMLGATKRFFRDFPDSDIQVLFSLPDHIDHQAFQNAL